MLKLHYLSGSTASLINFNWPDGYTLKQYPSGKYMITGGNVQNYDSSFDKNSSGYMVLSNTSNTADKLYYLQGDTPIEISLWPTTGRITHITGGGDITDVFPGMKGGGYIVFGGQKLYSLEGATIGNVDIAANAGNITLLSGGGGDINEQGVHNRGAAVINDQLYILSNNTKTIVNIPGGITNILLMNIGGYGGNNDNPTCGYLLAQPNNLIWYFDGTSFVNTNLSADMITSDYVDNKYTNGTSSCVYYTSSNKLYLYNHASGNDPPNNPKELIPINGTPQFLSGGGGYNDLFDIDVEAFAGYAAFLNGTQWNLYYLTGRDTPIISVTGFTGTIEALAAGAGRYRTNGSVGQAHGYLVTSEANPCVHPNTRVHVYNNGTISTKPISEIRSGDYVINHDGTPIRVVNNAKLHSKNEFFKISPNAYGQNLPNSELYITKQHPILLNGVETLPTVSKSDDSIVVTLLDHPVNVYTLITEIRTAVKMNNLDVYTWNPTDFANRRYNCLLL